MSDLKNDILLVLLNGGCVSNGYRVLDSGRNPVRRIQKRTFDSIRPLLRKEKLVFVLNKSKVRQEHGNAKIKRQYYKSTNN